MRDKTSICFIEMCQRGCGVLQKLKEHEGIRFVAYTLFYFVILVLLVLIYGFHDMNSGPFIYTEF